MPGDYVAYKVSLKCGSLEFVTTLKPEVTQEMMVSVQPVQVNADISLTPRIGGKSLREGEGKKKERGLILLKYNES